MFSLQDIMNSDKKTVVHNNKVQWAGYSFECYSYMFTEMYHRHITGTCKID